MPGAASCFRRGFEELPKGRQEVLWHPAACSHGSTLLVSWCFELRAKLQARFACDSEQKERRFRYPNPTPGLCSTDGCTSK
jgi:hypothetical protein